ncbi:MAG: hypothetical protein JWP63_5379 [Candidatus Solibacter sp.]|jgi:hypothetical protein|nr:hypothetical protein [Candidatus Solibacter sp.]
MRSLTAFLLFVCATSAFAQAEDPPEVLRAKAGIEKLRSLVEAGVAPRAQLDAAEAGLADAQDAALLRRMVYGTELTEDQADEMIAAATRRLERRKKAVADARERVDSGVASLLSVTPFLEEQDSAKKELDLAESRARVTRQLAEMARSEEALEARLNHEPSTNHEFADRYDGDGVFTMATFAHVELDFEKEFGKPLPVSAMGETAVHRSLGFDHRGRVDVAIHPDQAEGRWLLEYLVDKHIPYFAFRQAVPGKATGAHIHIGPLSTRYKLGG